MQPHPLEKIIGPVEPFMDQIFANMKEAGISLEDVNAEEIDHIGVRTVSTEQYNQVYSEITNSELVGLTHTVDIRGRKVTTFALLEFFKYKDFKISALELLEPAEGDAGYEFGPQHIEIVTKKSLEEIEQMYPQVKWKLARPESHNPELSTKFEDQTAIKFHPITLLNAVRYEIEHGIESM